MGDLFSGLEKKPAVKTKKAKLFCDGGSRGNPGPSASGAVLFDLEGNIIWSGGKYCGKTTNNVAEYSSLILGLEQALELGITKLSVFMDSKLAIEQMKGAWKVKNVGLKPLFERAKNLSEEFDLVKFAHVRREKNTVADAIVNKVLDSNHN